MKQGKEYEELVYKTFQEYYAYCDVQKNERILGKQSNIRREIDVSMRAILEGINFLYIVQCKDYNRPADVNVIGAFSAVIKDVEASKGFLVCASGFTKTIHDYARSLGIELLSVEDIESKKWKPKIEIPIIYIKYGTDFTYSCEIMPTDELIEKNKEPITITQKELQYLSYDNGNTFFYVYDYMRSEAKNRNIDLKKTATMDMDCSNLIVKISDINVPVSKLFFSLTPRKEYYLRYINQSELKEFNGITDYLTGLFTPVRLKTNNISSNLDDSYIKINGNDVPVNTPISFEIEEHPDSIGEIKEERALGFQIL